MNWHLLKNSLLVGAGTTVVAVSFGLVSAVCLSGLPRHWRMAGVALGISALALPPFLVTNAWLHFLGPTGAWRSWFPFQIVSFVGTIWILSLLLWPITMLLVLGAWQRLEPAQLESDMAVTGLDLFRGLLFPLAKPGLAQAAFITFVLALNNFSVPAILQVKTFPAEVWIRFSTSFDSWGSLVLSLPPLAITLVVLLWITRYGVPWPHLQPAVSPTLLRQQLGKSTHALCSLIAACLEALSAILPLAQILMVRRTWTELPGALAAGQSAVWNSFWLSAAAATLALTLALLGGTWQSAHRNRSSKTVDALAGGISWLPFLVPGVLLGIALIAAFNRPWSAAFYQSAGIVILALIIRYFGIAWNSARHSARSVDRDLLDAARVEGASFYRLFRHAWWPQVGSQVTAAWYVLFLLCLWDVESIILIIPPDIGETLALRIFNLLHYGHNAQVNALCLTLLVVALTPMLVWVVWRTWCSVRYAVKSVPRAREFLSLCAGALLFAVAGCERRPEPLQHSSLFSDVKILGTRGVGVGQLNKPRSVAVDAADNLYVVDMTGRVQKFSPNGVFQLSWQMPQTDLGKPKGMCRDRDGNIVVVEPHYSRVNHFSPAGQLVFQWGSRGTNAGQLSVPRAVALDSKNELFVSEYLDKERVQKFLMPPRAGTNTPAPTWLATLGKAGTAPGEFNRPEGLCIDSEDRLYVADSCNHRIQVFSRDGKLLRVYGKAGKGLGELSYPYDICVDAEGRQYVCEFGNSRIQVFDSHDRPIEIIGGRGSEPGYFSNPWGVALDSAGNLYVADSQNHRVQKLIRKPGARISFRKEAVSVLLQPSGCGLFLGSGVWLEQSSGQSALP